MRVLTIHRPIVDGEGPVELVRLDYQVEDVGILLDVGDAAAGTVLVDDILQQPTADRAVGGQMEDALPWLRIVRRLPMNPQGAAVAGERLGLPVAAAGPR